MFLYCNENCIICSRFLAKIRLCNTQSRDKPTDRFGEYLFGRSIIAYDFRVFGFKKSVMKNWRDDSRVYEDLLGNLNKKKNL